MFVRGLNPIWSEFNVAGQLFDDTYYAFFLTNTLPYLPQNVYQDINGTIPWSNPIEFQPNGCLPNNLYFDPSLVYRIEFRQGPTQGDPLIGNPIENYTAGEGSSGSEVDFLDSENLITNPQFINISFTSPITITTAGTYLIGPGWQLVLTGSGSSTITQVNLPGNSGVPGNPPYYLEINSTGWTTSKLIQQFNFNGALFADGSVSMSAVIFPVANDQVVTLNYETSDGVIQQVITGSLTAGIYSVLAGSIDLDPSANTNLGVGAYTQMQIILPSGTSDIRVTNVQFVGQSIPLISAESVPLFQEESIERQVDHEFHYYKSSIISQPKDSILTGWAFSLNPFQFHTEALTTITNQCQYIADQTILYQSTASSVETGRNGIGDNRNLIVKAINGVTNNKFALIQYIDPATILPYWNFILSSLAKVRISSPLNSQVSYKMRLIYRSSLPPTLSNVEPIASWTGTDPTFASGWTALSPVNDPSYLLTAAYDPHSFNGFVLPPAINTSMTLGIVIYTINNMNNTSAQEDQILFENISLVSNEFGIEANPQTFDQVLRECQYYYLKTFPQGTVPANATTEVGSLVYRAQNAGAASNGVWWPFPSTMRTTTPLITSYNTVSANAKWYNSTGAADSGAATFLRVSNQSVFINNAQAGGDAITNLLEIQATADARLGL